MTSISLIVPFYGVEKYIRTCLESLYSQDIPESDYEVVCVNDCSPDRCEEIVSEFRSKHDNLRLIRHETNKRLGAARNTGLEAAKGKYVWFIDSDDFIPANCLKRILAYCETDALEILHWSILDNQGRCLRQLEESPVRTGVDDLLWGSRDMTFPWNRVYNRDFLLRNNLWFNDLWGGDVIHTIKALNAAARLKNIPDCFYIYRVDNENSDMRSPVSAKKTVSFCYVLAKALEETAPEIDSRLSSLMQECVEWRVDQSLKPILKLPPKEKRRFYKTMRDDPGLKAFVLSKANWKVKTLLRCPLLSYIVYPIYKLQHVIK